MLSISNLTLGYDGKPLLQFNGMELAAGGQCLLAGPSGSGKTTLLHAIAGLNKPLKGTICINGTDISTLAEQARDHFRGRHIGLIFQALHLVKSLSVLENLLLASYVTNVKQSKEKALAMLAVLGLADKASMRPDALSQGQAQRVAIARAILHRPALILADEPTSSLDDTNCARVIELIQQVAADSGATLIISTHDARLTQHFSRVIQIGGQQ